MAIVAGLPLTAFAQATLTGIVRDTSGGVLPGVTVEASSPVLIEKSRSALTDSTGRYQIVDLRPGTYTVTFTLPSFSVVKRENVELTGTLTTTVNADLKVGTLQETVTVTGETPTVDTQNSTRVAVLDKDVIDALPTSRNSFSLGVLIPGMNVSNAFGSVTDVGGATGPSTLALNIHGGKTEDQRLLVNGVALSTMIGGGWGGGAIPNATGLSEIAYDYSGVDATAATGGVRINFIPRDGGNRLSGTIAGSIATDGMQPDTFRTVTRGNTTFDFPDPLNPSQRIGFRASTVKSNGELNPGVGGPFVRDKLWYFVSGRYQEANSWVTGAFHNKNANNPNVWTLDPDYGSPAFNPRFWHVYMGRLTWQAAPKHKIGFTFDQEDFCECAIGTSALNSPEISGEFNFPLQRFVQLDWNSPVSNRLLLEASGIHRVERWGTMHMTHQIADETAPGAQMIGVNEQNTGVNYRANPGLFPFFNAPFNNSWNVNLHYRAAVSYITGSHQFKAGFNNAWGHHENTTYGTVPYSYTFVSGRPTQIRQWASPYTTQVDVDADLGLYAQDKWAVGRATVTGAIRYDYFANSYPPQTLGPGDLVPGRNVTFDAGTYDASTGLLRPNGTPNGKSIGNVKWHDITPRIGLNYDLFGNGKTALKTNLAKYLVGLGTFSFFSTNSVTSANNPINRLVNNTTRPWLDDGTGGGIAGDFIPQCSLTNLAANGECGAAANPAFGQVTAPTTTYDPDYLTGWGKRYFNWEFSVGVQHEVAPRVSVDVGYFRRWYGNFPTTDNLAYTLSDFTRTTVTAPSDPRLPDGGGQRLEDVYYLQGFPKQDNYLVTFADNYGKQIEHWDGMDFSANARLRNGVTIQGGVSTGRTLTDNCELVTNPQLGELNAAGAGFTPLFVFAATPQSFCHANRGWITQYKGFAAYTIPRADVQVAGTYQGLPGPLLVSNYNDFSLATGFVPGAGNVFPFKTVQIIEPGVEYGDRMNQFDFRISKLLRFGRTRTMVGLDIYNLLNSTPVLTENQAFGPAFRQPLTMLQARFFKFSAQFDW
jgi:hypothetical protein